MNDSLICPKCGGPLDKDDRFCLNNCKQPNKQKAQLLAKYLVCYCLPLIRNKQLEKAFPNHFLADLAAAELEGAITHRQARDYIQQKVKEFKVK